MFGCISVETFDGVMAAVGDVEEIGAGDDTVLQGLEGQGPAWHRPGPLAALPQPVEEMHDKAPFVNGSAIQGKSHCSRRADRAPGRGGAGAWSFFAVGDSPAAFTTIPKLKFCESAQAIPTSCRRCESNPDLPCR